MIFISHLLFLSHRRRTGQEMDPGDRECLKLFQGGLLRGRLFDASGEREVERNRSSRILIRSLGNWNTTRIDHHHHHLVISGKKIKNDLEKYDSIIHFTSLTEQLMLLDPRMA
jgi:hypothetical protein